MLNNKKKVRANVEIGYHEIDKVKSDMSELNIQWESEKPLFTHIYRKYTEWIPVG